MPGYSIVISSINDNYRQLEDCLKSIAQYTEGTYEVIVVLGGEQPLSEAVVGKFEHATVVKTDQQLHFSAAYNTGLRAATGQYRIALNDDTEVTPGWNTRMLAAMTDFQKYFPHMPKPGIVGPGSNYVGGVQHVGGTQGVTRANYMDFWKQNFAEAPKQYIPTTWISGFCMMISPEFWESLEGEDFFDERFVNGCEDNHVCIRALYAGWSLVYATDVFIYHEGSVSLKQVGDMSQGTHAYLDYLRICREELAPEPKCGVGYRVKLTSQKHIDDFKRSLQSAFRFADHLSFVFNDTDDDIVDEVLVYIRAYGTPHSVKRTQGHDEARDRQMAYQQCVDAGMTWYFSLDADEVLEDKVDRAYVRRLMETPRPDVVGYTCHWYTYWDKSEEFFRADGIFGNMMGGRLVRILPGHNMKINESGLHMGNTPLIGMHGGFRVTGMRVKHLGYSTQEERERKYYFYSAIDKVRNPAEIGSEDYSHLIDNTAMLVRWREDSKIAVGTMVLNEERNLHNYLNIYWAFADELVFCDTGSDDRTVELLEFFGANVVRWSDVSEVPWDRDCPNYGAARNIVLDMARKVGARWYWQVDVDETPRPLEDGGDPLAKVRRMVDNADVDAYQFMFRNLNPSGTHTVSTTTRLMNITKPFEYYGTTHETVDRSRDEHNLRIARSPIEMVHTGWLIDSTAAKNKLKRYLRGNLRMIVNDEADPRGWNNAASHLLDIGARNTGTMFLQQALVRNPDFPAPRRELMTLVIEDLGQTAYKLLSVTHPQDPLAEYAANVYEWCRGMDTQRMQYVRHPEHVMEVLQEPEFSWVVQLIMEHDPHIIKQDNDTESQQLPEPGIIISA